MCPIIGYLLVCLLCTAAVRGEEPCDPNPCDNGGTCQLDSTKDSVTFAYLCICPENFTGPNCSVSSKENGNPPEASGSDLPDLPGPCSPNPCHNSGECRISLAPRGDAFADYTCECPRGFDGIHCQHNINECSLSPCQNGGICTDLDADYSCECSGEFMGKDCHLRCWSPLGLEGGDIRDDQITASSLLVAVMGLQRWLPSLARLNRAGIVNAWTPAQRDSQPWIQVNLGRRLRVAGVVTQGASRFGSAEYVRTFKLAHSSDGRNWTVYRDAATGRDKVFLGNQDNGSPRSNTLSPPIVASLVRLMPLTCRRRCTLRMELLGCETNGCSEPLGLKSGLIGDTQISASSVFQTLGLPCWTWEPHLARLNRQGRINAWSAAKGDPNQWLQIDLGEGRKITGIVTQGARDLGHMQFVRSYRVASSEDGAAWTVYKDDQTRRDKIFAGNYDNNSHKKNMFNPPIIARYVRVLPYSWYRRITLRVELIGCDF
ncbi:EGF-like repeat and discoidin I-like domain-containing protein 3 isoform X1 [Lethenteron reissneri]|uniref:EGF-like repeat and discoidin I-like domain-containing protein 3 isoform X1 n=1 Tax=Lethenteron reissneri TaxID=7753 RepID=UPI002AB639F3|nr:EGF-like repeat and discoidin I-like domain-containing protein 3 isoform X1 [Lethenteron reissneri]